jgi:hypothetical protein
MHNLLNDIQLDVPRCDEYDFIRKGVVFAGTETDLSLTVYVINLAVAS